MPHVCLVTDQDMPLLVAGGASHRSHGIQSDLLVLTMRSSHIPLHSDHRTHGASLSTLPVIVSRGLSVRCRLLVYTAKWACVFSAHPASMPGLGCQCAGICDDALGQDSCLQRRASLAWRCLSAEGAFAARCMSLGEVPLCTHTPAAPITAICSPVGSVVGSVGQAGKLTWPSVARALQDSRAGGDPVTSKRFAFLCQPLMHDAVMLVLANGSSESVSQW